MTDTFDGQGLGRRVNELLILSEIERYPRTTEAGMIEWFLSGGVIMLPLLVPSHCCSGS